MVLNKKIDRESLTAGLHALTLPLILAGTNNAMDLD
jgi:hypothetical protein